MWYFNLISKFSLDQSDKAQSTWKSPSAKSHVYTPFSDLGNAISLHCFVQLPLSRATPLLTKAKVTPSPLDSRIPPRPFTITPIIPNHLRILLARLKHRTHRTILVLKPRNLAVLRNIVLHVAVRGQVIHLPVFRTVPRLPHGNWGGARWDCRVWLDRDGAEGSRRKCCGTKVFAGELGSFVGVFAVDTIVTLCVFDGTTSRLPRTARPHSIALGIALLEHHANTTTIHAHAGHASSRREVLPGAIGEEIEWALLRGIKVLAARDGGSTRRCGAGFNGLDARRQVHGVLFARKTVVALRALGLAARVLSRATRPQDVSLSIASTGTVC
jgi:hypothetical protein